MKRLDRRKDAQLERQLAKALGFTKPWKSTPATLDGVAKNANGDKKPQGTRLLKAECGECGYTVRVTKKWLEAKGAPICPCNMTPMVADMPEAPEATQRTLPGMLCEPATLPDAGNLARR
jgi:hypothetical protein